MIAVAFTGSWFYTNAVTDVRTTISHVNNNWSQHRWIETSSADVDQNGGHIEHSFRKLSVYYKIIAVTDVALKYILEYSTTFVASISAWVGNIDTRDTL